MGTLSDLKKMVRTVPVEFGPYRYSVKYGMDKFTGTVSIAPRLFVLAVVTEWDLMDDGKPVPITEEGLKDIPYPFLEVVADAIQQDAKPGNLNGLR